MPLRYQVDRVERAAALDGLVARLTAVAERLLPQGPVRDALHGTWLGHPLHPMLTDAAIGAWTSAMLLDAVGGEECAPAARRLVGAGVVAAVPTAAAGLADWTGLGEFRKEKRVGVVHALSNSVALACYAGSWAARRRGGRRAGVALGMLGGAALGVGGMLGGHLAYRQAVGVDHTQLGGGASGWTRALRLADLPEGRLVHADAAGVPLVLHRSSGRVRALASTCTHMAGPLDEGELTATGGEACVKCPWHGSEFALEDGRVMRGPATAPAPAYDVRLAGDWVEVRLHRHAAADGGVRAPASGEVRAAADLLTR